MLSIENPPHRLRGKSLFGKILARGACVQNLFATERQGEIVAQHDGPLQTNTKGDAPGREGIEIVARERQGDLTAEHARAQQRQVDRRQQSQFGSPPTGNTRFAGPVRIGFFIAFETWSDVGPTREKRQASRIEIEVPPA